MGVGGTIGGPHDVVDRPRNRDPVRALFGQVTDKTAQARFTAGEFKAQTAPQTEVIVQMFSQGIHRAPPGQANASCRNASMSTFA